VRLKTSNNKGKVNSLPQLITGVVVNYNTPDLLKTAIASIRQFYNFPIIVIDGSDEPEALDFFNVRVKKVGYNIGHGLGMDLGIRMAKTNFVLTFDTDIEMKKPCIELMLKEAKIDTYAIGRRYLRNNVSFYNQHRDIFPYHAIAYIIDPAFQLVNKEEYLKYAPFISDGSPTVLSYHDLSRHKIAKDVTVHFPVFDYVDHKRAGTRNRIQMSEYEHPDNPKWLDKWKTYIGEHAL
jgi:glycosyltransferase involved in cell wall biosynthesis